MYKVYWKRGKNRGSNGFFYGVFKGEKVLSRGFKPGKSLSNFKKNIDIVYRAEREKVKVNFIRITK